MRSNTGVSHTARPRGWRRWAEFLLGFCFFPNVKSLFLFTTAYMMIWVTSICRPWAHQPNTASSLLLSNSFFLPSIFTLDGFASKFINYNVLAEDVPHCEERTFHLREWEAPTSVPSPCSRQPSLRITLVCGSVSLCLITYVVPVSPCLLLDTLFRSVIQREVNR